MAGSVYVQRCEKNCHNARANDIESIFVVTFIGPFTMEQLVFFSIILPYFLAMDYDWRFVDEPTPHYPGMYSSVRPKTMDSVYRICCGHTGRFWLW